MTSYDALYLSSQYLDQVLATPYLRHGGEVRISGDLVDDQGAVFKVVGVDVNQASVVLDVLRQL